MEGIVNDHTYFEPVEILFNGEGFLNNQLVTSPLIVTDAGEYILKLRGDNNYLETYYFQIDTETDSYNLWCRKDDCRYRYYLWSGKKQTC